MALCVVHLCRARFAAHFKILKLPIAVFILNGLVSTLSKMHQIEAIHPTVSSPSFVMLAGLSRFLFCSIALFFMRQKQKTPLALPKPFKCVGPIILCSAVISGSSYLLQLIGAQNLPATVLYPCINGGSIIFTALAAAAISRIPKVAVKVS